jgi:hypothetical protein
MIHQESTGAFRAGLLLGIGSTFGLVGLLLSAGGSVAGRSVSAQAPPAVAGLLVWGPRALLAASGALGALAVAILSVSWFRKST